MTIPIFFRSLSISFVGKILEKYQRKAMEQMSTGAIERNQAKRTPK
jgi:hypothetical protein